MLIATNRILFIGLLMGEFLLVVVLTAAINRLSPVVAGLGFIAYAALNGVTLSILMLVYTGASLAETFVIVAATFGVMTLFGWTTHWDLTRLGSLLLMSLLGWIWPHCSTCSSKTQPSTGSPPTLASSSSLA